MFCCVIDDIENLLQNFICVPGDYNKFTWDTRSKKYISHFQLSPSPFTPKLYLRKTLIPIIRYKSVYPVGFKSITVNKFKKSNSPSMSRDMIQKERAKNCSVTYKNSSNEANSEIIQKN